MQTNLYRLARVFGQGLILCHWILWPLADDTNRLPFFDRALLVLYPTPVVHLPIDTLHFLEWTATAKKHCKTQDILMVGGLSWGYVGPSWGYVGPSWGLCWPILGLCWPILELCWPILGLCWPILALCWPILRPMLAHLEAYVGPC